MGIGQLFDCNVKIIASIVNMLGMNIKLITTLSNYKHYPVWISSKRFNILLHLEIVVASMYKVKQDDEEIL